MTIIRSAVAAFALALAFTPAVSAQDRDCADFASQAAAQEVFNQDPYNDPFGLDGPIGPEFDGVQYLACEGNPPPTLPPFSPSPLATPTAVPTATPDVAATPIASAIATASPQANLPTTGAADSIIPVAAAAAALLIGGGLASRATARRRM